MNFVTSPLARFVRAVHRRQVALRVLERTGLGLLWGCVIAAVLVGVLLSRGQDAWGIAGITLVVGAVAGALRGFADRPTPLAAAAEADRQLDLADLLATAWALRADTRDARGVDPFRDAVAALASARCKSLSPSTVLLRRFGVRAWGGIALAVAFVATLAALSDRAPRADARTAPLTLDPTRETARRPILEITAPDDATVRPPRRVEQNPGDDRAIGNDAPGAPPDRSPETPGDPRAADERTSPGSSPGTGAGAARTNPPAPSLKRPPDSPETRTPNLPRSPGDLPAAGSGSPAENPAPAQVTGGGTLTGRSPSRPDAPWARPDWPTAVHSAREAVQSGRIPDDYRDLVHGYFDASALPTPETRPE